MKKHVVARSTKIQPIEVIFIIFFNLQKSSRKSMICPDFITHDMNTECVMSTGPCVGDKT